MNTPLPTLGERLDRLPWRPFHTRITLVLGVGWLLDAFEVSLVGNVLGVLKRQWNVSDVQASALVSVWLAGIMFGALLFGYLADRYGRRRLFLATLLLYAAATVISALSPGYVFFLVSRFLTAVGIGAEYSAINAAIGELIPARVRGRATALVMNFWPLGSIAAALASLFLINLLPPAVGWRLVFALGAIVAVFSLWARRNLPESPRWLRARGRTDEAEAVLRQIEGRGAAAATPLRAPATRGARREGFWRQLQELCVRHPWRLAFATLLDAAADTGYYGIFAFLPLIVLPQIHITDTQVPWFFLVGNVSAIAGGLLVVALLDRAGRKWTVTTAYALAAAAMLVMGRATQAGNAVGVLVAFIGVNFFATMSWVSAYPTFSEIFPTRLRATGIGFAVGVGHVLAGIAPVTLIAVAHHVSVTAAFALLAGSFLLGVATMVPWILYGPEGRGRALEALAPREAATRTG
ncbi:MAG: MFS transporter [Nevskiaceae bacterium]|nr:MAG: MFS transporter [Nevskiaceae bacterium]TBR71533.1 MAG: MFS transporter [Nevskiaceae bacterium]